MSFAVLPITIYAHARSLCLATFTGVTTLSSFTMYNAKDFVVGDYIWIKRFTDGGVTLSGGRPHLITAITGGPINATVSVSPDITSSAQPKSYEFFATLAYRSISVPITGTLTATTVQVNGKPVVASTGSARWRVQDAAAQNIIAALLNFVDESGRQPDKPASSMVLTGNMTVIFDNSSSADYENNTVDYQSTDNWLRLE